MFNEQFGFESLEQLEHHKSDAIRSIACFLIGVQKLNFFDKLSLIKNLANDKNSGVREWAWMAIREKFVENLSENLPILANFAKESSPNLRRFASEMSRPRGVWCKHIKELKAEPWLGMEIIELLKADEAKYVQLSVGNWLNDAGKDHADWVKELCNNWQKSTNNKNTLIICKRALRNL